MSHVKREKQIGWASDGDAEVTEPSDGRKALGYTPGAPVSAEHLNFAGKRRDALLQHLLEYPALTPLCGWTLPTLDGSPRQIYGIAVDDNFAAPTIVIVGEGSSAGTPYLATSTDGGATWTEQTVASASNHLLAVAYDTINNIWVACESGASRVHTASDPTSTWTARTCTGATDTTCVVYDSYGEAVFVGSTSGKIFRSTDGTTYAEVHDTGGTISPHGLHVNSVGYLLAVYGSHDVAVANSPGTSWTEYEEAIPDVTITAGVVYHPPTAQFYATSDADDDIYSSIAGITWVQEGTAVFPGHTSLPAPSSSYLQLFSVGPWVIAASYTDAVLWVSAAPEHADFHAIKLHRSEVDDGSGNVAGVHDIALCDGWVLCAGQLDEDTAVLYRSHCRMPAAPGEIPR